MLNLNKYKINNLKIISSWSDESSWVYVFLEKYLVELTVLKLHFTRFTLIQKLADFVTLIVEVTVTYSEVTEDCFKTCFHSDLSVSENREESVVDHRFIDYFTCIAFFLGVKIVAAIVGNRDKKPSFIKYLFVSKSAWVESWDDRVFGFDD